MYQNYVEPSYVEILLQTLLTLRGAVLTHMHACGNPVLTLHGCLTPDVTIANQDYLYTPGAVLDSFFHVLTILTPPLHNVLTGFPLFW